ncbi:MAG: cytochrome c biogenesis protein CcdA [Candidatus Micrarchaeia archaeon]
MADLSIFLAFFAGLVSFLSPCVLPLIPAYLTFLAGTSVQEKYSPELRTKIFLSSVSFVLGFSLIFSVVGVLLQSVLSGIAYDLQAFLGYVGGVIIIFFGLMMIGIIRIESLEAGRGLNMKAGSPSYLASFLFGAAFAVGWTPCVGVVLGGILTLAVTNPAVAFPLMLSYSLGLGVPFLLVGLFVSRAGKAIKALGPYIGWLDTAFGIILVILGILVFTGTLPLVANFAPVNDLLLK